jgi:hypothetical protein
MGRSNKDFKDGKDHTLSWTTQSGDMVTQQFPTSQLNPNVDKQRAVGKHLATYGEAKPAKGSKVTWKADE